MAVLALSTNPAHAQTVPEAPTGLTAPTVTHNSVTLSWDDPGDSTIESYQILRRSRDEFSYGDNLGDLEFTVIEDDTESSATTYIDNSVAFRWRYIYRVKARNANGLSPQSNFVDVETLPDPRPAAPTGLTASAVTDNSVTLSWDDPGDSTIESYQILRRSRDGDEYEDNLGDTRFVVIENNTGSSATTYTDNSVDSRTRYVYRVKARNSHGLSPQSNFVDVETLVALPTAPTGLTASATTHNSVTLSWDDPGDSTIESYQIRRRSRDGAEYEDNLGDTRFVVIEDDTGSSAFTYTDYSVDSRTRYVYRVYARNSIGLGPESLFANAETSTVHTPSPPTGEMLSSVTHYSVTLTWDEPEDSTIESYQVIRRSRDGTQYGDNLGATTFVPIEEDTGSTATTYTDYSVTAKTRYVYALKSINASGLSVGSGGLIEAETSEVGNTDATLTALDVNSRDIIGFRPDRTNYAIGVSHTVASATINATPAGNATVSYGADDADTETEGHQVNLQSGLNSVTITVTAEDDVTTRHYTLSIGRGNGRSSDWMAEADLDGLITAGNEHPYGMWGNDENLWIVDTVDHKVYAYNWDGSRDMTKEFSLRADNVAPTGIWSDATIMWVADTGRDKLFAYRMSDGSRVPNRDINLVADNSDPAEIWSDGETIWVLDSKRLWIFAYKLADKQREATSDLGVRREFVPDEVEETGLWLDDENYWTVNNFWTFLTSRKRTNYQWDATRAVYPPSNIGITDKRALWSDGTTMWVVSASEDKVYAFNMPRRDASLSDLAVSPRDIVGFSSDQTEYHLGLGRDVDTVTISAATTDSQATISYSHSDINPDEEGHQVLLAEGLNVVTVTVTAYDRRTTQEYTLNIGRSLRGKHEWRPVFDLNGIAAAENNDPVGIWGNETTIWISDIEDGIVYAYNRDGTRDTTKDISFGAHTIPTSSIVGTSGGIWFNDTTMWIAYPSPGKVYAFNRSTGMPDTSQEFSLASGNLNPTDIWSDGTTMWVTNFFPARVFAYTLSSGARDESKEIDESSDFTLTAAGIWSDGATLWVADRQANTLRAYSLDDRSRASEQDITLPDNSEIDLKRGLWSDGHTMWTIDSSVPKVFAFNLLSSDSRLSDLQVSPKNIIGFKPDRYSYAVGVSDTVTTATIVPTPADSNATVAYSVADADPDAEGHQVDLADGLNSVTVSVTSEDETFTETYTLEIGRGVSTLHGWRAGDDLDGLIASGNENPAGISGSSSRLRVLDAADKKVYRYRLTGVHEPYADITLVSANAHPAGIWDNQSTLYVGDTEADKLFAYSLWDGSHLSTLDITLDSENGSPRDIWSSGEIIWVLDAEAQKIFAYLRSDGTRRSARDIDISSAVTSPSGIWSDGSTVWVVEDNSRAVTAWNLSNGARVQSKEFNLPAEVGLIEGKTLWSYGPILWVTSAAKSKVYAVNLFRSDSTLSSLSVSPDDIIGFSPSVQSYKVGVASTVSTVTINAVPSDNNATISYSLPDVNAGMDGHQIPLFPGPNPVTLTVIAQDGISIRRYILLIGRGSEDAFGWRAQDDLDGLAVSGNLNPFGIWGNESTLWVVDGTANEVFAYKRNGTRDTAKGFTLHADNSRPTGIWSNGTTMWVADVEDATLFAYTLSSGARSSTDDIELDPLNSSPGDIWSDDTTIWVVNVEDAKLFAYTLSTRKRDSNKDIDVSSANTSPTGIWSDGETLWVADGSSFPLLAWELDSGNRDSDLDFALPETIGLSDKRAVWAYDRTLWITTADQSKVFAFNLPNDDASLSGLTVAPENIIGFTSGRYSYAVGMASTVTTATILATSTDPNATVSYSFSDADDQSDGLQFNLNPGPNIVTITVTAEDQNSKQLYTLTIARGVTDNYGWKAVDDLDGLIAADNLFPVGLWADDTHFYVADDSSDHIYVYDRDGNRVMSKEIALDNSTFEDFHRNVNGIWSDGATMWAVDYRSEGPRLVAYALSDGSRDKT